MTGKEAKNLVLKHFESQLNKVGFKQKKRSDTSIEFLKSYNENSFYYLGISIYTYSPAIQFGFVSSQRIAEVEKVFAEINKQVVLFDSYNKYTPTLYLNEGDAVELRTTSVETEEELITLFSRILVYFQKTTIPILEKFQDIREIDKLINGEGENFWEDNNVRRPFELKDFYARRLIIARLSKTNEAFEELVEKVYAINAKRRIEKGSPPLNRNDISNPINIIVNYLRDNVIPIF